MNILEEIAAKKLLEVKELKAKGFKHLEQTEFFNRKCYSMKENLLKSQSGIISEFKRKSPSKGWIKQDADPKIITKGYQEAGASAISCLTNLEYFGGSEKDLLQVRETVEIPILRKEFIVDEYQILEAKSIGADAILLISAILTKKQMKDYAHLAKELGLETLMEIHSKEELDSLTDQITMVGINNRDLRNFTVNVENGINLLEYIPNEFAKISESGISNPATVKKLRQAGFNGFLIGENFMKTPNPGEALHEFINQI